MLVPVFLPREENQEKLRLEVADQQLTVVDSVDVMTLDLEQCTKLQSTFERRLVDAYAMTLRFDGSEHCDDDCKSLDPSTPSYSTKNCLPLFTHALVSFCPLPFGSCIIYMNLAVVLLQSFDGENCPQVYGIPQLNVTGLSEKTRYETPKPLPPWLAAEVLSLSEPVL